MRYLGIEWLHPFPDEPVTLYSELDDKDHEVRKIEFFADGRIGFASATEATGSTVLGEKPVPCVEEIAADPQFRPVAITREEFERMWESRYYPIRTPLTR